MANGDLMPVCGIVRDDWSLKHVQSARMSRSGVESTNTLGEPYWVRSIEVQFGGPTMRQDFAEWEAFLIGRQGNRYSFTAPRVFRLNPQAGETTDAGMVVQSASRAASMITLAGTDPVTVSKGDMLSFYTANAGYWIGMSMEDAEPVDGAVTVKVHPAPFAPHASQAQPRRTRALGEFRLLDGFDLSDAHMRKGLTITATQVIRG